MKMLVDLFLDSKPKDVNVPKKTLKKLLHTGEKHNLSIHFKTHLYYLSSHTQFLISYVFCSLFENKDKYRCSLYKCTQLELLAPSSDNFN